MKILIADDHAIVRRGLKQVVADDFEHAVVGEASTGQSALEAIRTQDWDVIVLDINFPDKNGVEVLKEIKLTRPHLPVVVLSLYPEEQYALRVLKAGGSAYLTKESAPEELVACLKKVLKGGRHISAALAERLAGSLGPNHTIPLHQTLSDRELQVLRLIAMGKTVTDIADEVCLSVKTISTYRARLLKKLKLNTTAELIRFALDNQLVA